MIPLPLINGAFFVSGSFLETISRCAQESEFSKLTARVAARSKSGMNFGKHIHSALELHYRLQEFSLTQQDITQRVSTLLQQEFETSPNDTDDFRTLNWAVEIYKRFTEFARFESFELLTYPEARTCKYCEGKGGECLWCNGTGKHKIMAEVPFAVKLFDYFLPDNEEKIREQIRATPTVYETFDGSIPVYLHGYIDLPIKVEGMYFIRDFKTTLMLGDSFWQQHKMSIAQKGYCYGFEQTTKLPVTGHVITAIRTAQPPIYVSEGRASKTGKVTKIDDWWKESIMEQRMYLGDGELTEWKKNAEWLVRKFLFHYDNGFFPRETTQCISKFGACQYYEVCSTFPPEIRASMLSSGMFMDKESGVLK